MESIEYTFFESLPEELVMVLFNYLRKDSNLVIINERIKRIYDTHINNILNGNFDPDEIFDRSDYFSYLDILAEWIIANIRLDGSNDLIIRDNIIEYRNKTPNELIEAIHEYTLNIKRIYLYKSIIDSDISSRSIYVLKSNKDEYIYINLCYFSKYNFVKGSVWKDFYKNILDNITRNYLLLNNDYEHLLTDEFKNLIIFHQPIW